MPFFHRALAALAAIWDRFRGLSMAALAAPPLRPPRRPRATAWGFLVGSTGFSSLGLNLGAWPVDSSMIWYASWFGSLGRFFDRSGIPQVWHFGGRSQAREHGLPEERAAAVRRVLVFRMKHGPWQLGP